MYTLIKLCYFTLPHKKDARFVRINIDLLKYMINYSLFAYILEINHKGKFGVFSKFKSAWQGLSCVLVCVYVYNIHTRMPNIFPIYDKILQQEKKPKILIYKRTLTLPFFSSSFYWFLAHILNSIARYEI